MSWPARMRARLRRAQGVFKKMLSPSTTLMQRGIAAIWHFTLLSQRHHTYISVRVWLSHTWDRLSCVSESLSHDKTVSAFPQTVSAFQQTLTVFVHLQLSHVQQQLSREQDTLWIVCESNVKRPEVPFTREAHANHLYTSTFTNAWKVKAIFLISIFRSSRQI